ncbi:MAG: AMP-binding protein [Flavobacteriaceae bacterium]|nr:AMP-binding protein [Flavobacteriaceae bacterium]
MNRNITYSQPHASFKLNGIFYDNLGLSSLAVRYTKVGEGFQFFLGHFIAQWIDSNSDITLQTSGSTGTPKTILISKQAMVNSAIATGDYFKLRPGNSALSCLPYSYIAAKMMFVRAYILGLELEVVEPSSTPLKPVSKSYDFCAMVPLQVENSIQHLHQIKTLIVGGAKLSNTIRIKLNNSSANCYETFGMTETVSHIAVKKISSSPSFFEVLPSVSIKVDSRSCLSIEAPELVSTPIQTNDIVKLISKSSFEWIGRYDSIINSGGIKISPEQLEQQLDGFIKERFFIASQKDDKLGEVVVMVIERSSPYDTLSFDAIEPLKRPKDVYYIDQFKETLSGKIKRQETLRHIKPASPPY